tara:strand:+ start:839 stop:1156 length:318 start_codon:yes stop_codon:yes gene_type:complete
MYKIRGKVISKKTIDINNDKGDYKKLLFTIEEGNIDYKHLYQFEIFGEDNIQTHIKNINENKYITIDFYIRSNQWKDKFFYTLVPKYINQEDDVVIHDTKEDNPF